jgi:hypothetical protein
LLPPRVRGLDIIATKKLGGHKAKMKVVSGLMKRAILPIYNCIIIVSLAQKNVPGSYINMIYAPLVKLFDNGNYIKQGPFPGIKQMRKFRVVHKCFHYDSALPYQSPGAFLKKSAA